MLATISVAAGNETYDSRDNCNAIIETAQNRLITGCKNTVIPEGITSLGSDAFSGCRGMSTLYIPASLIQGLGTDSGYGLHDITKDMTSIVVASGNPVYDSRNNCNAIIETATNKLLMGCPTTVIPNGVTTIGEEAFYRCVGLTSIDIPSSVTSIEKSAFRCSGLTSVFVPSSVKSLGKSVFEECLNLSSVTLSEGIETLGYGLFIGTAITSLTIPSSVHQIGDSNGSSKYLCETCPKLSSIVVANGNSVYDSRNNCNAIIETATNTLITGCKSTVIPEGVTAIASYAFYGCMTMKELNIPKSVRDIKSSAFRNCFGLEKITVTRGNNFYDSRSDCNALIQTSSKELILGCRNTVIPQSISKIGSYAFYMCPITSITIPANVTDISSSAFCGCSKLKSVISLIEEPFEISNTTFYTYIGLNKLYDENGIKMTLEEYTNIDDDILYGEKIYMYEDITLYVPGGTKTKYEATSCWNEFKEIIEIDPSGIKDIRTEGAKSTSVYNISGQKLTAPRKGINIIDGRKVVVK